MNPDTKTMLDAVLAAMQPADEIGGLDPVEYVRFMHEIAKVATERARNAIGNFGGHHHALAVIVRSGPISKGAGRLAYRVLEGPYLGSVFIADRTRMTCTETGAEVTIYFNPDDQFAREASWPHGAL